MDQEKLKKDLNQLWAGVMENITFDPLKNNIILQVKVIENAKEENFKVEFDGVSAFYWVRNNGNKRFNLPLPDEGDFLELTSIDYFGGGIGEILIESASYEWAKQYFSSANFALEIWSSMLFIEAKSITINDKLFEIDHPILNC